MFNPSFNNNFQNVVPNQNTDFDPYQDQYFGENDRTPYVQAMNPPLPGGGAGQNNPYPIQSSLATPGLNPPVGYPNRNYAEGGEVKKGRKAEKMNPYPSLAEMIRQQGKGEDTILAHINPLEAMILQNIGGSGTINPKTGLPQFGLFSNPKKWLKSVVGPAAGVVLGNMILPGIGGMIGGGLGGAAGSTIRGRKDAGQAALRGFGMGATVPTLAGLAGSGLSSLGASGVGNTLSSYGTRNAILPSLGLGNMFGGESGASNMGNYMGGSSAPQSALASSITKPQSALASSITKPQGEMSFTDKLLGNTEDFLTKPKNLLTLGSLAGSFMNRPKEKKEKTPEQQADEHKRLERALRLSPADRASMEANLLAEEQMRRRIVRQKFLPEERLGHIEPLYQRSNTPEEYKKHGKWLSYYNNPEFSGEPIPFKKGGPADIMSQLKNDPTLIIELNKRLEEALKQPIRPEIIARGQKLTTDIIEKNKNQHKGLLDEKSLNRDFTNLTKTLGLTEGEVYALERYTENIFKDNQFTTGPGYFYTKAHGNPITMKMGGSPNHREYFEEEMEYPSGLGRYIAGDTSGQDDKIQALLSDGEYVIPADAVAHLGDGNNAAGAKKLDMALKNIRKHRGGFVNKLPPKAKSLASYIK